MPPLDPGATLPAADTAPSRRIRGQSIALITKDNGAGLSVDLELLDLFLTEAGYTVRRIDWRQTVMPRADIAIFLELYSPTLARHAAKVVGIFNPEWFLARWKPHLPHINQLWCKSRQSHELYTGWGLKNAHYTGFFSRYLHHPGVPRQRSVLHLQGHSTLKNTPAVLEAWRRFPDLPPLTVVTIKPINPPPGVTVRGKLPGEELVRELNTHRIHLCPSRAEGWGHYITEGLSAGAHVITTDASPMNEHVYEAWGTLIRPKSRVRRYDVFEYQVDPDCIARAVFAANALTDTQFETQGEAARAHFFKRNEIFRATALNLLEQL